MSSIKEKFSERMLRIKGVKRFMLVRNDGEILIHNFQDQNPDTFSSILLFSTMNSEKLRSGFGFRKLKYLYFSKDDNENLFVFPIDKYYLGVTQHPNANSIDLLKEISSFIDGLLMTKDNTRSGGR